VAGRFVNKVALVVGAAGRGRPLCRALQADGAQVIGADRDQAGLMALSGEVDLALTLDPDDTHSRSTLLAILTDRYERLDCLLFIGPSSPALLQELGPLLQASSGRAATLLPLRHLRDEGALAMEALQAKAPDQQLILGVPDDLGAALTDPRPLLRFGARAQALRLLRRLPPALLTRLARPGAA
jgi:hypothetical protein